MTNFVSGNTLSVSLWIDHHPHEQDGVSAMISDHHQKRTIGDEAAQFFSVGWLQLPYRCAESSGTTMGASVQKAQGLTSARENPKFFRS